MEVCKDCRKTIQDISLLKCIKCRSNFHFDCVTADMDRRVFLGMLPQKKGIWCCSNCTADKTTAKKGMSDSEKLDLIVADLSSVKITVQKIVDIETKLVDIEKSLDFLSSKYDDINKKVDMHDKSVNTMQTKLDEHTTQIDYLKDQVVELQQTSLSLHLEICGLKEAENNETAISVAYTLGVLLGVDPDASYIEHAYRVSTKKNKMPRPLVIVFSDAKVRKLWLQKTNRVQLTNGAFYKVDDTSKIYINELLTPFFKSLLWKAKVRGKETNFKFVWTKEGRIFVRRAEGNNVLRIRNEIDLLKMV